MKEESLALISPWLSLVLFNIPPIGINQPNICIYRNQCYLNIMCGWSKVNIGNIIITFIYDVIKSTVTSVIFDVIFTDKVKLKKNINFWIDWYLSLELNGVLFSNIFLISYILYFARYFPVRIFVYGWLEQENINIYRALSGF